MKLPGPDHPVSITRHPRQLRVSANGRVVARTARALALKEASYPEVKYIPRDDADLSLLVKSDRVTHCPYKGDASYYSIRAGDTLIENAIWSYEAPYPAMREIAGYLAFYPDKVAIEDVTAN